MKDKFATPSAVLFHGSREAALNLGSTVRAAGWHVRIAHSLTDLVRRVWQGDHDTVILADSGYGHHDLRLAVEAIRMKRPNLPIFVTCPLEEAIDLARAGLACEPFSADTLQHAARRSQRPEGTKETPLAGNGGQECTETS